MKPNARVHFVDRRSLAHVPESSIIAAIGYFGELYLRDLDVA